MTDDMHARASPLPHIAHMRVCTCARAHSQGGQSGAHPGGGGRERGGSRGGGPTWCVASSVMLRPSATATSQPSLDMETAPNSELRRYLLGRSAGVAAAGLAARGWGVWAWGEGLGGAEPAGENLAGDTRHGLLAYHSM